MHNTDATRNQNCIKFMHMKRNDTTTNCKSREIWIVFNAINAMASFLMQPTTMLKSKKCKDYIKIDILSFLFLSVSKLRYSIKKS